VKWYMYDLNRFLSTCELSRAPTPPPPARRAFLDRLALLDRIPEGGGAKMLTLRPGAKYPRYATVSEHAYSTLRQIFADGGDFYMKRRKRHGLK
jgi:hypothetical protein